jgi:hypothetical protein
LLSFTQVDCDHAAWGDSHADFAVHSAFEHADDDAVVSANPRAVASDPATMPSPVKPRFRGGLKQHSLENSRHGAGVGIGEEAVEQEHMKLAFFIQFGDHTEREKNLVLLAATEEERDEWLSQLEKFKDQRTARREVGGGAALVSPQLPATAAGIQTVASLTAHASDVGHPLDLAKQAAQIEHLRGLLRNVAMSSMMMEIAKPSLSPIFPYTPIALNAPYAANAREGTIQRATFIDAIAEVAGSFDSARPSAEALFENIAIASGVDRTASALPRSTIVAAMSIVCVADPDAIAVAVFTCFETSEVRTDMLELKGMVRCLEIVFGFSVRCNPNGATTLAAAGQTVAESAVALAKKAFRDMDLDHNHHISRDEFVRWLRKNHCRRPKNAAAIEAAIGAAPTASSAASSSAPVQAALASQSAAQLAAQASSASSATPFTTPSKATGAASSSATLASDFAAKQKLKTARMKETMAKLAAERAAKVAKAEGAAPSPKPRSPKPPPGKKSPTPPPPAAYEQPSGHRAMSIAVPASRR